MENKCPQCNGNAILEGKIYNQIDYVNPPAYFRPNETPFYLIFGENVSLKNNFAVCTFCGFLWAKVDSDQLQRIAKKRKAL